MAFHIFLPSQKKLTIFSFIMLSAAICQSAPTLISPTDDARFGVGDPIVIFEWDDPSGSRFEIELAIDEEFTIGTGPISAGTVRFYNLSDLIPDEIWAPLNLTIFWRVRSVSTTWIPGEWSHPFKLHKSTLQQPDLIDGTDGRYNHLGDMPILTWDNPDFATRFSVEFAMDDQFNESLGRVNVAEPVLDFTGMNRTSWDVLEGIFYWRVSTLTDSLVPGPWSGPGRISKTRITAPHIISPDDGAAFPPHSEPAVLEWESLGTIDRYEIRLFADPDCTIEIITLVHSGYPEFDLGNDLGISDEVWWYAPFTMFWSIAGVDSAGRPGPFSDARELIKPGYHRVAAYGDSITDGKCVDNGYLDILHNRLVSEWDDQATTVNIAEPGMKSRWGAENMESRLMGSCPQYVLIMFGTNDSVDPGNCDPQFECDVPGHMAQMVIVARERGTIPIISTIIPVNPEGNLAGAQDDVDANNEDIINMAFQMGVDLVDLNAMFWDYGDLSSLFCDWGHPNEAGYDIMANGFFDGIMAADPG
ncbi:SGNH/GDSL hydrolase family protein [bacterium]|nr:SGNH/GDSL hydrolase family protein [candidate division CSSED10-310 bacterium]